MKNDTLFTVGSVKVTTAMVVIVGGCLIAILVPLILLQVVRGDRKEALQDIHGYTEEDVPAGLKDGYAN